MKNLCVSAVLVLFVLSVPAFAKGKPAGRGNDKHEEKSDKWKEKDKDHKKDWRDHDRDRDHGRVAHNSRPPGWDKGKKTGWGNCDVPPGQAKKEGCRSKASHRTVTTRRRTYPVRTRTYPTRRTTTTTTTTTTTSTANPPKKGGHPFEPVLREKQKSSSK